MRGYIVIYDWCLKKGWKLKLRLIISSVRWEIMEKMIVLKANEGEDRIMWLLTRSSLMMRRRRSLLVGRYLQGRGR
jgi:hypothetical protein